MGDARKRILAALADGQWHSEPSLRSSFWFLQRMWLDGLIDGSMKTLGATADDRLWRLMRPMPPAAQSPASATPPASRNP